MPYGKPNAAQMEGLNPSILQWVIMQDVVESISVQIMEYMFGSIGFYAPNGRPNLAVVDKETAVFYVLLNAPVLVGISHMLELYALDLGGYILGAGITWQFQFSKNQLSLSASNPKLGKSSAVSTNEWSSGHSSSQIPE